MKISGIVALCMGVSKVTITTVKAFAVLFFSLLSGKYSTVVEDAALQWEL